MTHQKEVPGYLPDDYKIIKQNKPDGTVVFKHPIGKQVEIVDTDLYSFFYEGITQIQILVDLVDSSKSCD